MKVLVTGASGFIGQWLVRCLVELGHDVTITLRSKNETEDFKGLPVREVLADILDPASLHQAVIGQEHIYHLAGVIAYSKRERDLMFKVNVGGTENILSAATRCNVQRVLLVSSVVAVGATFYPEVLNEKSPYTLGPYHLGYHESKRAAEALLKLYVENQKVDGVIVNPSTVYGAGDAKKGSRSTQLKVAKGKGLFYPKGGVSVVGVEDVVNGMIAAMNKGRSGERYILAGENLTLNEVFAEISRVAGVAPPKIPMPQWALRSLASVDDLLSRLGGRGPLPSERALVAAMYHWYDSTKAQQELGYQPRPASEAIEKSVLWMKENGLLGVQ